MPISRTTRAWMYVFAGGCLLLSWGLALTPQVETLEQGFQRQLLALTPGMEYAAGNWSGAVPALLQQALLLGVFLLIVADLRFVNRDGPVMVSIILVAFALLMVQLLGWLLARWWLPTVWPNIAYLSCSMVLYFWARQARIRNLLFPRPACQLPLIRQHIDKNDYNTAILILKGCRISDELFELAYELGIRLEQEQNWALARSLYQWLAQYDPGIQDFVQRIDQMTGQSVDPQDLSLDEVTESRGHFGHFQLLGKKARGATATVYEAYDMHTHRRVALKILNQRLNDDSGERDVMAFVHEAAMVAHLDHPNIVKIHDADTLDDRAYIAMDYIAGYPMSERLRRRKLLTAAESLRIMRSVLSALVLAQQKGIVHGDIKPANIMYDKNRKHYIITDFGAAYSHQRRDGAGGEKRIIGTPAYMSPEQLTGGRTDGRSDLFSLAVTIYHLLSGRQPFTGEKLSELKHNILHQEVDMNRLSVPESIKQVLNKALQKKPYQRFADASQMLHSVLYCQQKLLKKKNGS